MKGFIFGASLALITIPTQLLAQVDLASVLRVGDVDGVRAAIEAGADVGAPVGNLGMTPLHISSIRGDAQIVQLLLEAGAPVDSKTIGGLTPLSGAVRGCSGDSQVIRALIEAGADPNVRATGTFVTPLHLAIQNGHNDAAQLLLDLGADAHALNFYGDGLLSFAIQYRQPALIQRALDLNVSVDQLYSLYAEGRFYQIDHEYYSLPQRLERCES